MGSAPEVVDISSDEDEDDDSPPVARKLRFDDAAEDGETGVCDLVVKNEKCDGAGVGREDGDCVVLDGDPDSCIAHEKGAAGNDGSSDELQIVAEKGQVACRDFPHPRHLCSNMPFVTTCHEKHCTMCYCFVCDVRAPCIFWGNGLLIDDHCRATDKETKWRSLRQAFKRKNLPASHPEKENVVSSTMVYPTMTSPGRLSLADRSPLQDVVNQNQECRASLNVEPAVNAPRAYPATRAGNGTSNPHTAQVTHLVQPIISVPSSQPTIRAGSGTSKAHTAHVTHLVHSYISAPRPHPAIRAGSSTSNAHTAQVTHLVEPTISEPRPHPAITAGSGASDAHTAQVTNPIEPTVSAHMPYPTVRAGRVTSNVHTAQTTHPVKPTVSAPRANLPTRAARDTSSNGHTAEITDPAEPAVSAPRAYIATRAERNSGNAHTAEITYPATAFNYLPEPDQHEEDEEYMTEEEYETDGVDVYVGNLPYQVNNGSLALTFEHAGVVLSSKVIYNKTGQRRGFGFVTMSTIQEAERAVRMYHGYKVCGRRLIVQKAAPRGTTPLRQGSYQQEVDEEYTSEEDGYTSEEYMPGEDGYTSEEEDEPREEVKVYVGNLHYDIDSLYLAELFDYAGIVEDSKVIYDRNTDQSRGFGFVTMSTVEEAERAVEIFHRHKVYGRRLTVRKAAPRHTGARVVTPRRSVSRATPRSRGFQPVTPRRRSASKATPRSRHARMETPRRESWSRFEIYVGNLPWQVDDYWLKELFSEHGEVLGAKVVYECRGGTWRSRGFGFVTMATEEETLDAIYALNKKLLEGRALRVKVAKERPQRGY